MRHGPRRHCVRPDDPQSWLARWIRQNELRELVNRSSHDDSVRHQLYFINRWRVWQTWTAPLTMRGGVVIADDVRRLARNLFPRR